jgi:hypothetical protein
MNKKYSKIYTNLQRLFYFCGTRMVGHTYLMVNGIEKTIRGRDRKIIMLVRNHVDGEQILKQYNISRNSVRLAPYNDLEKLRGMAAPMAMDNSAIWHLLRDALDLISYLLDKINTLENQNRRLEEK